MKKDKKQQPDDSYDAKMNVLHELRQTAMDMMGDKVRDKMPHKMKEVSVMAPDKAGLEKGLDMAKNVLPDNEQESEEMAEEQISPGLHHKVANMMDQEEASESPQEEAAEGPEYDDSEHLDEIESMIQELMDKKNELLQRK